MEVGVIAVAVTLIGITGGIVAWMIGGPVVTAAFVAGVAFSAIGIHLVEEAF